MGGIAAAIVSDEPCQSSVDETVVVVETESSLPEGGGVGGEERRE